MKLKIGDTVKVVIGKDRGRTGKVESVLPKTNRLVVAGVNRYQKHLRRQGEKSGEKVERTRPLPVAKVALICPHCHQQTRVGYQGTGSKKIRLCRKCKAKL